MSNSFNSALPPVTVSQYMIQERSALETIVGRSITDREFADHLGIGRTTLLSVLAGGTPGTSVLSGLLVSFDTPQTERVIINFLRSRAASSRHIRKPIV